MTRHLLVSHGVDEKLGRTRCDITYCAHPRTRLPEQDMEIAESEKERWPFWGARMSGHLRYAGDKKRSWDLTARDPNCKMTASGIWLSHNPMTEIPAYIVAAPRPRKPPLVNNVFKHFISLLTPKETTALSGTPKANPPYKAREQKTILQSEQLNFSMVSAMTPSNIFGSYPDMPFPTMAPGGQVRMDLPGATNDFNGHRNDRKRPLTPSTITGTAKEEGPEAKKPKPSDDKRFACPFTTGPRKAVQGINDNKRCMGPRAKGWQMSRLVEHIKRSHLSGVWTCGSCLSDFETETKLEIHRKERGCPVKSAPAGPNVEKIDEVVAHSLGKKSSQTTAEQRWAYIYRNIYGLDEADGVPSPYFEGCALRKFERWVESRVQSPTREQNKEQLEACLKLVGEFRETERLSYPSPGPPPLGYDDGGDFQGTLSESPYSDVSTLGPYEENFSTSLQQTDPGCTSDQGLTQPGIFPDSDEAFLLDESWLPSLSAGPHSIPDPGFGGTLELDLASGSVSNCQYLHFHTWRVDHGL